MSFKKNYFEKDEAYTGDKKAFEEETAQLEEIIADQHIALERKDRELKQKRKESENLRKILQDIKTIERQSLIKRYHEMKDTDEFVVEIINQYQVNPEDTSNQENLDDCLSIVKCFHRINFYHAPNTGEEYYRKKYEQMSKKMSQRDAEKNDLAQEIELTVKKYKQREKELIKQFGEKEKRLKNMLEFERNKKPDSITVNIGKDVVTEEPIEEIVQDEIEQEELYFVEDEVEIETVAEEPYFIKVLKEKYEIEYPKPKELEIDAYVKMSGEELVPVCYIDYPPENPLKYTSLMQERTKAFFVFSNKELSKQWNPKITTLRLKNQFKCTLNVLEDVQENGLKPIKIS